MSEEGKRAAAEIAAQLRELKEALRFFVDHPGVSQLCTPNSKAMKAARAALARAERNP